MDRGSVGAFVARDRYRVAALKRDHHASRYRASRGSSGLETSRPLREHVRKFRPDWPTEQDRDEDLAQHVALKRRIGVDPFQWTVQRFQRTSRISGSTASEVTTKKTKASR